MSTIELKPRQVENIQAACLDLDSIKREFEIAEKTGLKIPDELLKAYEYCKHRTELYRQHYINSDKPKTKGPSNREIINV
jgi:hypothetical protein